MGSEMCIRDRLYDIHHSYISRMSNRLEESGLIKKIRKNKKIVIKLTEDGRKKLEQELEYLMEEKLD